MKVLKFKSFNDNPILQQGGDANIIPWVTPKETNNSNYLQDYLKTIVGRLIKADFLINSDNLVSKEGILKEVGSDYIVLDMLQSNGMLLCDLYSIKFVEIV